MEEEEESVGRGVQPGGALQTFRGLRRLSEHNLALAARSESDSDSELPIFLAIHHEVRPSYCFRP